MTQRDKDLLIALVVGGAYIGQLAVVSYLCSINAINVWWMLASLVGPFVILVLAICIEGWLEKIW